MGLDNIESVTIIYEYICSDHLPRRVVIRCDLATNHHCVSGRNKNYFIDGKQLGYMIMTNLMCNLVNIYQMLMFLYPALINRIRYMKVRLTGCMAVLSKV